MSFQKPHRIHISPEGFSGPPAWRYCGMPMDTPELRRVQALFADLPAYVSCVCVCVSENGIVQNIMAYVHCSQVQSAIWKKKHCLPLGLDKAICLILLFTSHCIPLLYPVASQDILTSAHKPVVNIPHSMPISIHFVLFISCIQL